MMRSLFGFEFTLNLRDPYFFPLSLGYPHLSCFATLILFLLNLGIIFSLYCQFFFPPPSFLLFSFYSLFYFFIFFEVLSDGDSTLFEWMKSLGLRVITGSKWDKKDKILGLRCGSIKNKGY